MSETIGRIANEAGLDDATAAKAVGLILAFLEREGPGGAVGRLMAAFPEGRGLADAAGGEVGMGGIMGLGAHLMGAGLSMPQIQAVSHTLFAAARERAGDETLGEIVAGVPGLSQFV